MIYRSFDPPGYPENGDIWVTSDGRQEYLYYFSNIDNDWHMASSLSASLMCRKSDWFSWWGIPRLWAFILVSCFGILAIGYLADAYPHFFVHHH